MWTRTKLYLTPEKKPTQATQTASTLAAGSRANQIQRQRGVHRAAVCDHSCEMPPVGWIDLQTWLRLTYCTLLHGCVLKHGVVIPPVFVSSQSISQGYGGHPGS